MSPYSLMQPMANPLGISHPGRSPQRTYLLAHLADIAMIRVLRVPIADRPH